MSGPPPLGAGHRIAARYEVIEHLDRGRALDVYDVWSYERACRCIAKAPRADRISDPGTCRSLLEEGRLLCRLTHPHIVRGYETLEDPSPLVVMETLAGETLAHMIETRALPLSVGELAHLGLHLASATRYLHRHGYLHLDLKPSNVIADGGKAKLIDLSVARPPGRAHAGIGTMRYMAPEQARGGELGAAADIWGIGMVLFEAAAGAPAFDDPGVEAAERTSTGSGDLYASCSPDDASLDDEYPQLGRRAPRVEESRPIPSEFADLVAACLEPREDERPDLRGLLATLEALAELPMRERRHAHAGREPSTGSERAPAQSTA